MMGGLFAVAHSEISHISPLLISPSDIIHFMTPDEARERVQAIRDLASDDEVAHSMEDSLYQAFVLSIASASPHQTLGELVETASIILTTGDIQFSRWYA